MRRSTPASSCASREFREGRREHAKRLPLLQPAEIAATRQPARTTWPSGSLAAATGNVGVRLRPLRLEEFDGVAGWILDEDLAAARPFDDLTTEARPLSSETLNVRVEIGNDDLEPIPSSRLRNATGFARAAYARLVESHRKSSFANPRIPGRGEVDTKAEAIAVEVDRLVDVCDELPTRYVMWTLRSLRRKAEVSPNAKPESCFGNHLGRLLWTSLGRLPVGRRLALCQGGAGAPSGLLAGGGGPGLVERR